VLRLAVPLILSMTGYMLMQFIDGILLAWHSAAAVAALGPAGMAAYVLGSTFTGAVGYTSTLVAQYTGADRAGRIGTAVWQGIYLALASGLLVAACGPLGHWLFGVVGHPAAVRACEAQYFAIICYGTPLALLAAALSGFFSGRGDTRTLMGVQLGGLVVNAILAWALIFGRFGLPAWGMAGAAVATVTAQGAVALTLAVLFLHGRHQQAYATRSGWRLDREMLGRLLRFGLPGGLRLGVEILGWTLFLFFVGRLGTHELAATSIAWRINGLAFFPIIGVSEAIRVLVGQSQGRGDTGTSQRVTVQGTLVAEVWMLLAAALFLLAPRELFAWFQGSGIDPEAFGKLQETGVVLLRFVAIYCLMDAFNITVLGALMAAGDTRWTSGATGILYLAFVGGLVWIDHRRLGLYAEWSWATVFVLMLAVVWVWRFRSGAWKRIRVLEPDGGPPNLG
jgi:MATE family multidrug resistance protein